MGFHPVCMFLVSVVRFFVGKYYGSQVQCCGFHSYCAVFVVVVVFVAVLFFVTAVFFFTMLFFVAVVVFVRLLQCRHSPFFTRIALFRRGNWDVAGVLKVVIHRGRRVVLLREEVGRPQPGERVHPRIYIPLDSTLVIIYSIVCEIL